MGALRHEPALDGEMGRVGLHHHTISVSYLKSAKLCWFALWVGLERKVSNSTFPLGLYTFSEQ